MAGPQRILRLGWVSITNPETDAWRSAVLNAGGFVTDGQTGNVDTLVSALKSEMSVSSLAAQWPRIWLEVSECWQQSWYDLANAAQPSSFLGTGTFASRWALATGYTGNGSDNAIDSGVFANDVCTQNSASIIIAYMNNRTITGPYGGAGATNNAFYFNVKVGSATTGPLNSSSGATFTDYAGTQGLYILDRAASDEMRLWRNKVANASNPVSNTSEAPGTTNTIYLGGRNEGTLNIPSADSHGLYALGLSVGAAHVDGVSDAFNDYLDYFGASLY